MKRGRRELRQAGPRNRMEQGRKIAAWLVRGLLLALLGLNLFVMLCPRGLENSGSRLALLEVMGGSMEPVLHDGDAVLIYRTEFDHLATGDIIVFQSGGELILHEIIRREGDALITKGTANQMADSPVTEEMYRSRMLFRIPLLGSIWQIYESPVQFAVFTVLVALLIFGKDLFGGLYRLIFERGK